MRIPSLDWYFLKRAAVESALIFQMQRNSSRFSLRRNFLIEHYQLSWRYISNGYVYNARTMVVVKVGHQFAGEKYPKRSRQFDFAIF